MAAPDKSTVVSSLFTELIVSGKAGEYEKAIKVANKILQDNTEDGDALHYKIVCLIQLDRFDEALKCIHKNFTNLKNISFEKAYCEYRLNQVNDSLKTLRGISNPDIKCKELLAQVLYRLEEFDECLQIYQEVIRNADDSYEDERETNLTAVLASIAKVHPDSKSLYESFGIKQETYETVYNTACFHVGKGEMETASIKLNAAEELCREMLAEEADDDGVIPADELDAELALLRVQMGYVLQLQGKKDEALKLYNMVAKQKPDDVGIAAVVANNIVTINKDQNVFDSKKRIRVATADNVKHKLNSEQKKSILINNCLLMLYTNQFDLCKKLTDTLIANYPNSRQTAHLIKAALLVREKKMSDAVKLVSNSVKDKEDDTLNLILTLAQLHLQQGSVGQACQVLNKHSIRPGILATLVTLYSHLEDTEMAEKCLWQTLNWYKKNKPNSPHMKLIMTQCSKYMMKNGNYESAAKLMEEIRTIDSKDSRILAQLISAYSHFNANKANELSSDLPSADEMAAGIDVDSLESGSLLLTMKYGKREKKLDSPAIQGETSSTGTGSRKVIVKKKNKKKKGPLPKNYDASVDPDPERWLPRWERSAYQARKKRDKRRGGNDVGKGTQGASAAAMAELDASIPSSVPKSPPTPGSPKSSPGVTAPQQPPGPRLQKPTSAAAKQKKKKKGGNKW